MKAFMRNDDAKDVCQEFRTVASRNVLSLLTPMGSHEVHVCTSMLYNSQTKYLATVIEPFLYVTRAPVSVSQISLNMQLARQQNLIN